MYEANLPRGNFASGVFCLHGINDQQILKKQGTIDFNQIKLDDRCNYYIGHVQAPTSAMRKWSYDTSHPFESLSWSVVHNGVLTNEKELRKRFTPWLENPVDSSLIPEILQYVMQECDAECPTHEVIKETLNLLEGTFALCIVDTDCNEVFVARQGSILHINDLGDVSTLKGEGFRAIPEGKIFKLIDCKSWEPVETFKTKSPFLLY